MYRLEDNERHKISGLMMHEQNELLCAFFMKTILTLILVG